MRRRWVAVAIAMTLATTLYLSNSSALAERPTGAPGILAHRGIHQTFSGEGLTRHTCTATRIDPPTNPYLENTLASMRASFAVGATALELDVHPTIDGEFAVFHDWGLECRTNGEGTTRSRSMAYLATLDVGYGYTADGGRTFPFRGKGVRLMPTLGEVLRAFPDRQFLINIKSGDPAEADLLVSYLKKNGVALNGDVWVFADGPPGERLTRIAPEVRVMSRKGLKSCSVAYLSRGWSGRVPVACRGRFLAVPTNLSSFFWGWPNRLLERAAKADVEVLLVGPVGGSGGIGVDRVRDLRAVPRDFPGHVITNRVEVIGPALLNRR